LLEPKYHVAKMRAAAKGLDSPVEKRVVVGKAAVVRGM
jgi:hypothetical protein